MGFKMAAVFLLYHLTCLISQMSAQTGSSFFYYYSPNQPMVINSQTFGSNAQSHQQLLHPGSSNNNNNNPFNFNPSSFHSHHQQKPSPSQHTFPTAIPFVPQRQHSYDSTILDKITFNNSPATRQPPQQVYQPHVTSAGISRPTPTSAFPGQPQPSAKLFNFLNQPFQFFPNSFSRFQQPQQAHPQQTHHTQEQEQPQQYLRPISPQQPITIPPTVIPNNNNNNNQLFYNYYNRGAGSPQSPQTTLDHASPSQDNTPPMTYRTPVFYAVNQFFSAKTTQGPTSYSFTIGADPTNGPTATVQVSMGTSAKFPMQFPFPTLVPLRQNDNQAVETISNAPKEHQQQPNALDTVSDLKPNSDFPEPKKEEVVTEEIRVENVSDILTTTPQPIESSFSKSETLIPSTTTTSTTIHPEITSTTTTTTIAPPDLNPISQLNIDEPKTTQKRVIIRKKIPRRKYLRMFENVDNANSISQTEANKPKEPVVIRVVPIETVTEPSTTTTQSFRIRTYGTREPEVLIVRSRTTTTSTTFAPVETTPYEPITSIPTTTTEASAVIPETERTTNPVLTSTTTEKQLSEPYEILTTTEKAVSLKPVSFEIITLSPTTEVQLPESTTITTTSTVKTSEANFPEYDEEYYEYYSDADGSSVSQAKNNAGQQNNISTNSPDTNNEEHSSTEIPVLSTPKSEEISTSTASTAYSLNSQDEISSTELPFSSSTESNLDNLETSSKSTLIEEDVIEPLSTTEPQISSTTETLILSTTEDVIGITSTLKNEKEASSSVEPFNVIATTVASLPNKEMQLEEGKTEDYSDVSVVAPEVGGLEDINSETKPIANQTTTLSEISESGPVYDDFPEEYNYSQEEYPKYQDEDPLEDQKIIEAQRAALQNALKNIRNRLQNASSTTETPVDETSDHTKKFMRRPINVDAFPSSTSTSVSISSSYDHEEIGDSRTQIIRKIQTFKTKLRKVASGNRNLDKNFVRSTTKRPRRVTRPSDKLTSEIPENPNEQDKSNDLNVPKATLENTSEISSQKPEIKITTFRPRPTFTTTTTVQPEPVKIEEEKQIIVEDNVEKVPEPVNSGESGESPLITPDQKSPIVNVPKNSPKLVGELIIREILPTQSTTTEISLDEEIQNYSAEEKQNDADFETENSSIEDENPNPNDSHSSTRGTIEAITSISVSTESESEVSFSTEAASSSTLTSVFFANTSDLQSKSNATTTQSYSEMSSSTIEPILNVKTAVSKSESVRERKVKVILKRKKGAPVGSGTIARQVVRTRTRVRPKVSTEEASA